jgi:tellurite resistance protein TehA-like permease
MGSRRFSALAASWGLFAIGAFSLVGILLLFRLAPPGRPSSAGFWALLFPLALLVGSGIDLRKQYRALRRERWRSEGRCVGCGYFLRGNVSGVCPECGKPANG